MMLNSDATDRDMTNSETKNDIAILCLVYLLAHGLLLLNSGIFWDDWVIQGIDENTIRGMFLEMGQSWAGQIHLFLAPSGPFGYRVAVFASHLLAALLLFDILKGIELIDRRSRFYIVIIFSIFPVNFSRIAMINTPYSVCYVLFFLGFWLLSRYLATGRVFLRIASLSAFILSFFTNSFLVFYALAFLFLIFHERDQFRSFRSGMRTVLQYADYASLPVLFWVLKLLYMRPYGLYDGYNRISFNVSGVATTAIFSFYTSFIEVLIQSFSNSAALTVRTLLRNNIGASLWIFLAFLLVLSFFLVRHHRNTVPDSRTVVALFLLGIGVFFLAVFPYAAVGKLPTFQDWSSRHQMLVPLGAAFMIVYGLKMLSNSPKMNAAVFSVLIGAFIAFQTQNYLNFQRDWYKQLSLVENFRTSSTIQNNTAFLFTDNTGNLNANGRAYRFYEYSGLLKKAFGDEKRFGENRSDYAANHRTIAFYGPYLNKRYSLGEFIPREPDTVIDINYGRYRLDAGNFLSLMISEKMGRDSFRTAITGILQLTEHGRLNNMLQHSAARSLALNDQYPFRLEAGGLYGCEQGKEYLFGVSLL